MDQSPDPLHGITLEKILTVLVEHYGWQGLAEYVDVRCFKFDPSIKSRPAPRLSNFIFG
jgi:uncharacterized protein (DUF2132 family)